MRKARWGRRLALCGALLVLGASLAACGGGGGGNQNQEPSASQDSGSQGQEISVEMGSFYFKPDTITVKQGQPVTIRLTSTDIKHNFAIDEFNVSEDVDGGSESTITFTPDKAGEFEIYCDEPGHEASGMVGKLIVEG